MTMKPYRYTFEPYVTPRSRHTCPQCGQHKRFTRYIDTHTNTHLAPHVGMCDRTDSCGYHYTPRQYFAANPNAKPRGFKAEWIPPRPVRPSTIPAEAYNRSLKRYGKNYFVQYLLNLFEEETVFRLINDYNIGTAKRWRGATIFWQVDHNDKVRTGKIMLYDPLTGKRVKEPYAHIAWVHKVLRITNFNLKQCFFGEHLLNESPLRMVGIVESEKTAIIASAYMPQYCWLAAGSLEGLTFDKCRVLEGREVMLFADTGAAFTKWEERMHQLRIRLPGTRFGMARTAQHLPPGTDIADWLVGVRSFQTVT